MQSVHQFDWVKIFRSNKTLFFFLSYKLAIFISVSEKPFILLSQVSENLYEKIIGESFQDFS